MDYFGVIKKAFKINLKNKFLWIFGILAGGAAGFNGFNSGSSGADADKTFNQFMNQKWADFDFASFWNSYGSIVVVLLVLLTVLSIVFFVLNLVSQGALIGAVDQIEFDEKTNFGKSFKVGWKNFWRIWGLNITLLLAILIVLSFFVIPTCLFVINGSYTTALVVGILLFLVNTLFWVLVSFISPYALRIVVLKKLTIFQSIRQSLHFVRDNLAEVFVMYLLLAAIGFVFGLALVFATLIVLGLFFMVGYGLYLANPSGAIIYGIIVSLASLAAVIAVSGGFSSFSSTVLTLTYLKLTNKN